MSVDLAVSRLRRAVAGGIDLEAAVRGEPEAVSAAGAVGLAARGRAELRGAGVVLQPLLDDPAVTDVLVNGGGGVWVDRGDGLEVVPAAARALGGAAAVRALATRLAAAAGQRLDDACPVVDGSLADGTRLHVILPPLAPEGPLISLRTQRRRAFTLAELVAAGTVAPALAPVLRALVTRRANVLVSGATGSGKTTLLAALLSLVPADERIVCIEESTELAPTHPHVVHLQTRRANVQSVGEVPLTELVRAAMRMRPDRMVLGECRGAEVREVLGALNTGHEGGWAPCTPTPRPTSRRGWWPWARSPGCPATPLPPRPCPVSTRWCTCAATRGAAGWRSSAYSAPGSAANWCAGPRWRSTPRAAWCGARRGGGWPSGWARSPERGPERGPDPRWRGRHRDRSGGAAVGRGTRGRRRRAGAASPGAVPRCAAGAGESRRRHRRSRPIGRPPCAAGR